MKNFRFSRPILIILGALVLALIGVASLLGVKSLHRTSTGSAEDTRLAAQAFNHPALDWHKCDNEEDSEEGLDCAELIVPLDYNDFNAGIVTLPVTRHRATDENARIGSLFTNPGGPANPATSETASYATDLGQEVQEKFDVIGIAPRGIEGDEKAECTLESDAIPHTDEAVFPLTDQEIQQHFAKDQAIQTACSNGPRILAHMSTADVARDMDQARKAVGDEKITYYGISYGTYLGATYAALFPQNMRALVVDGVVDPVGWATGLSKEQSAIEPVDERLSSGVGAQETLNAAISECEKMGLEGCSASSTIREDWNQLSELLQATSVRLPDGSLLRYDSLVSDVMGAMYSPTTIPKALEAISDIAADLVDEQEIPEVTERPENTTIRDLGTDRTVAAMENLTALSEGDDGENPAEVNDLLQTSDSAQTFDVGYPGVLCGESTNPTSDEAFVEADNRAIKTAPGFGQLWNWQSSVCTHWPVSSVGAYKGPFDIPTSVPVLIIGNEHDPATPYAGAVAYHEVLPTSRLVTVEGAFGHGALGISTCVDDIRTDYLVRGEVPKQDRVCTPDQELFAQE